MKINRGDSIAPGTVLEKGDQVNFFTVLRKINRKSSRNKPFISYRVQCVCGKVLSAPLWVIKEKRVSCGCMTSTLISDTIRARNKTQDNYTVLYPLEYKSYGGMIRRCYNKNDVHWENYGGRGIKVCPRWKDGENGRTGFQCFIDDMGRRPFTQYSMDRIDGEKSYSPENCRWADKVLQANNIRSNIWKRLEAGKLTLKQACDKLGIPVQAAASYIENGGEARDLKSLPLSILAFDPGLRNFAACHVKHGKVRFASYVQNTLDEIKNATLTDKATAFMHEMMDLLDYTKPDVVVIERFMARRFSAKIIELIAMMIGMLVVMCNDRDIKMEIISSSQWKIPFKRLGDLTGLYAVGKNKFDLEPHVIDAMCMCRYVMSHHTYEPGDKAWLKANLPQCVDPT